MGRRKRWGGAGLGAMLLMGLIVPGGCDAHEPEQLHRSSPYRVDALELRDGADELAWAADEEEVQRWLDEAIEASDEGLSKNQGGLKMRATVNRRIDFEQFGDRSRLTVGMDAQLERIAVPAGAQMVFLSAQVEYRHSLAEGDPSPKLLRALSRTLERRAAADAVKKLRLRAQIRQSGPAEVARWIGDREIPAAERIYAVRRAGIDDSKIGDEALRAVVAAGEDPKVAVAGARALIKRGADDCDGPVLALAEQLSRDREYSQYLQVLGLLGELDAPHISIYLDTVAKAHRHRVARQRARELVADRPPLWQAQSMADEARP